MDRMDDDRIRALRYLSSQIGGVKKPHRDAIATAEWILNSVEKDFDDGTPDSAETIFGQMDKADQILAFDIKNISDCISLALKANVYKIDGLEDCLAESESLKECLINLRLDYLIWAKRLEDECLPATPEELEAEDERTRQLYIQCGIPLPPGLAQDGTEVAEV